MKFLKYILFIMIFGVVWTSCDSDLPRAELSLADTKPSKLANLESSYVITADNADRVLDTLNWTATVPNVSLRILYKVEIAKSGTNFEYAYYLTDSELAGTQFMFTGKRLNDAVIALYASMGDTLKQSVTTDIDFRVSAILGASVAPVYSNVVKSTVTTYMDKR